MLMGLRTTMTDLHPLVWRTIVRMSLDEPTRVGLESLLRWVFDIEPTMAAAGLGSARPFLAMLETLPLLPGEEPMRAEIRNTVLMRVFGEQASASV